ncbi:MAG TPA: hypothetical protein VGG06_11435 [Thermoanaerobaculia bacterium]|jgi:hypothetical protein
MANGATRSDVTVTFAFIDGSPAFTYTGTRVQEEVETTVRIPPGTGLTVFQLEAGEGVRNAAFVTRPFQYVEQQEDGTRVPLDHPPPGFFLQRNSPTQATLTSINTLPGATFRFYLIILADGVIYGDDPVLINEPPP